MQRQIAKETGRWGETFWRREIALIRKLAIKLTWNWLEAMFPSGIGFLGFNIPSSNKQEGFRWPFPATPNYNKGHYFLCISQLQYKKKLNPPHFHGVQVYLLYYLLFSEFVPNIAFKSRSDFYFATVSYWDWKDHAIKIVTTKTVNTRVIMKLEVFPLSKGILASVL